MTENIQHTFIINMDLDGMRLDKAISTHLTNISRSRVQTLIKQGQVSINGVYGKWGSSKVRDGMEICITLPDTTLLSATPENIPLDILFEDEHLLLINKPSGMVVHPAPGNENGTLVNAVLYHAGDSLTGIGGIKRPGIVHRIDKHTSGVVVVAKSDIAHNKLTDLFKTHDIERSYVAFVWGHTNPINGSVQKNIGRHKTDRKKMSVLSPDDPTSKTAVTHYKTLYRFGNIASKIECILETGRTHQIRVHMTHGGNGLIGDPVYGRMPKGIQRNHPELYDFLQLFNRQALHAKRLGFTHPVTGKKIFVETAYPKDMQTLEKYLMID